MPNSELRGAKLAGTGTLKALKVLTPAETGEPTWYWEIAEAR